MGLKYPMQFCPSRGLEAKQQEHSWTLKTERPNIKGRLYLDSKSRLTKAWIIGFKENKRT